MSDGNSKETDSADCGRQSSYPVSYTHLLGYWNDWLNGLYYINKDTLYSIQVLLNRMLLDTQFLMSSASQGMNIDTSQLPSTGIKMAIAVMGILPVLIVYPFLQKYLVQGITIGAVKG